MELKYKKPYKEILCVEIRDEDWDEFNNLINWGNIMGKTFNVPYFNFLERKDFDDKVKAFEKAFEQGFETEQELNSIYQKEHKDLLGYEGGDCDISFGRPRFVAFWSWSLTIQDSEENYVGRR